MTRYPLYFKPGDDETRVFKYLDSTGAIVNLTGYSATFTAYVGTVTQNTSGTVDGPNGKVTVTVTHANTSALGVAGSIGSYELRVTAGSGLVTTLAAGPLVMLTPKD